eukprot:5399097-Pyramimonas_sp.AAC.1
MAGSSQRYVRSQRQRPRAKGQTTRGETSDAQAGQLPGAAPQGRFRQRRRNSSSAFRDKR